VTCIGLLKIHFDAHMKNGQKGSKQRQWHQNQNLCYTMPAKVEVGFARQPHQCGFRIELRHMELKLGPGRPATVSNEIPSNCPGK